MDNEDEKLEKAKNWYVINKPKFETCTKDISKLIDVILKNKGIVFHSITHRVKAENSFLNKCEIEKYNRPEEQITDLAGIRIITYTNKEVKQISEIIKNEFNVDLDNSDNKADNLGDDKVGYLSVHYVASLNDIRGGLPEYFEIKNIKFEIQIRTLLQHTWAEIEHDKNYKFNGKLRKDLIRRFYLIAGVLELLDHEFEKLSDEIDEYANDVSARINNGDYNIAIDSTSLIEYMRYKTNNNHSRLDNRIIDELKKFELNSLKDIEEIIKPDYVINREASYIGILRDVMIISNAEKYFDNAYSGEWEYIFSFKVEAYKKHGIDITPFLEKHNISIRNSKIRKKSESVN